MYILLWVHLVWIVNPLEGVWGPLTSPLGSGTVWRSRAWEIGGAGVLCMLGGVSPGRAGSRHIGSGSTSSVLRTEKIVFLSNQRPDQNNMKQKHVFRKHCIFPVWAENVSHYSTWCCTIQGNCAIWQSKTEPNCASTSAYFSHLHAFT